MSETMDYQVNKGLASAQDTGLKSAQRGPLGKMGSMDKGILCNQNDTEKLPYLHAVPHHWSTQTSSHRTLTMPQPATF